MGKEPLKENTNVYFQARKRAAMSNDRLFSRENAAELLGISPYTLADYELGNTKVVPVDKVVLMADLYNAPELITGYCKYQCPIHGFMPLATEEKNLQGIALRLAVEPFFNKHGDNNAYFLCDNSEAMIEVCSLYVNLTEL